MHKISRSARVPANMLLSILILLTVLTPTSSIALQSPPSQQSSSLAASSPLLQLQSAFSRLTTPSPLDISSYRILAKSTGPDKSTGHNTGPASSTAVATPSSTAPPTPSSTAPPTPSSTATPTAPSSTATAAPSSTATAAPSSTATADPSSTATTDPASSSTAAAASSSSSTAAAGGGGGGSDTPSSTATASNPTPGGGNPPEGGDPGTSPGGGEQPVTTTPSDSGTNSQNPDSSGGPTARDSRFPLWAILITVAASALLILFLIIKCHNPRATHFDVIIFFVALIDFGTDIWFIFTLHNNTSYQTIYILAILFTSLPFLSNFVCLMYLIHEEIRRNLSFRRWMMYNYAPLTGTTLVACTNIDAMFVLDSHICNLECTRAPFTEQMRNKIRMFGFITICFEDIPQVILQIYMISSNSNYQLVNIIVLCSSCINIIFGLTKRALVCCVVHYENESQLEQQMQQQKLQQIEDAQMNKKNMIATASYSTNNTTMVPAATTGGAYSYAMNQQPQVTSMNGKSDLYDPVSRSTQPGSTVHYVHHHHHHLSQPPGASNVGAIAAAATIASVASPPLPTTSHNIHHHQHQHINPNTNASEEPGSMSHGDGQIYSGAREETPESTFMRNNVEGGSSGAVMNHNEPSIVSTTAGGAVTSSTGNSTTVQNYHSPSDSSPAIPPRTLSSHATSSSINPMLGSNNPGSSVSTPLNMNNQNKPPIPFASRPSTPLLTASSSSAPPTPVHMHAPVASMPPPFSIGSSRPPTPSSSRPGPGIPPRPASQSQSNANSPLQTHRSLFSNTPTHTGGTASATSSPQQGYRRMSLPATLGPASATSSPTHINSSSHVSLQQQHPGPPILSSRPPTFTVSSKDSLPDTIFHSKYDQQSSQMEDHNLPEGPTLASLLRSQHPHQQYHDATLA